MEIVHLLDRHDRLNRTFEERDSIMSLGNHLEKIAYFQTVCEAGTFRKASQLLRLSQSSLSVAVTKLESSVGRPLLIRTKRGVRPTTEGELMLKFARDLRVRMSDLSAKINAPAGSVAGQLRLGAYDSIAIYLLPQIVRHLQKQFPHVVLTVAIGSSLQLMEKISAGDIDIAIAVDPPNSERNRTFELYRDKFSCFATRDVLQRGDKFSKPVADYLIGMFSARVTQRKTLADLLNKQLRDDSKILSVESFEIAKSLALQGLGVAVLPHRVAEFGGTGKQLHKIKSLPCEFGSHRICLILNGDDESQNSLIKAVGHEIRKLV